MKLKRFTTQLAAAGLIALPLMASAAGLGKLSVSSALGQPLSAEIELFAADKAELDSLSATLASDQAFRDARVEFSPVLPTLRFAVEKKPNGKAVLKVTSTRPVNDPFIDMLVELSWASGRLVREYTMLLDPPGMGGAQAGPPVTVAPAVSAPAAPKPAAPQPAAPEPRPAAQQPAAKPAAAAKPAPAPQPAAPERVQVRRGDTLLGIAKRVRPEGVSLEQTLVGLYQGNPAAFDGDNMNRLKAGKTLNMPEADKLTAIPQADAVREIKLQAEDWRAYRQKLAEAARAAPEAQAAPGQTSSGKITPKVEDKAKPAPDAQKDVLKLSKAPADADAKAKADDARALQEKLRAQEEDAIARQKALDESNQRVSSLEKQIQDLQKLVEMKDKALTETEQASVPPPEVEAPPVPAPQVQASPPPAKPAPAVETPVAPEPAENWYDPLLANPLYWGGGLAALGLGGLLWWMMVGNRRRPKSLNTAALDDSIMSGGDLHANTVVGAASGGSVNTGDTSFLTDFSQAGLGTIDTHDVDPIAEAEVYMAYGRDAQAEEILKEALVKNPDRHEVRVKLLEIYAARRNVAAFETVAGDLFAAIGNQPNPLWDKACEMGRSIDPTNPLYGGVKAGADASPAATVAATAAIAGGAVAMDTVMSASEPADAPVEPEPVIQPDPDPVTASAPLEFESAGHVLSFGAQDAPESGQAAVAEAVAESESGLDFELPELDLPSADEALELDLGLESDNGPDSTFDFSGLDLDLGDNGGDLELDEVGTKLDLARAYVEMGDKEGAREILNEVLAEGSDKQKADAKGILSALG